MLAEEEIDKLLKTSGKRNFDHIYSSVSADLNNSEQPKGNYRPENRVKMIIPKNTIFFLMRD